MTQKFNTVINEYLNNHEKNKSLINEESILNDVRPFLDTIGLISIVPTPWTAGIGFIADAASAMISWYKNDKISTILSIVGMIPTIGDYTAKTLKIGYTTIKSGLKTSDPKIVANYMQAVNRVKNTLPLHVDKLPDLYSFVDIIPNLLKYGGKPARKYFQSIADKAIDAYRKAPKKQMGDTVGVQKFHTQGLDDLRFAPDDVIKKRLDDTAVLKEVPNFPLLANGAADINKFTQQHWKHVVDTLGFSKILDFRGFVKNHIDEMMEILSEPIDEVIKSNKKWENIQKLIEAGADEATINKALKSVNNPTIPPVARVSAEVAPFIPDLLGSSGQNAPREFDSSGTPPSNFPIN